MCSTRKFLALLACFFVLFFGCDTSETATDDHHIIPAAEVIGMNSLLLERARHYGRGAGCIMRGGKVVYSWGSQNERFDLKSTTKSIGVTALGLAIKDGKVNLSDKGKQYVSNLGIPPDGNKDTGWLDDITLFHLATHTAGFEKSGGYISLLFEPGTAWAYSDGGANWLADCLTLAYGQDLKTLMFDRVFTPLGISSSDLTWRDNAYREDTINGIERREFGSGISANVDAMARIGYLYLRGGRWKGQQIIPQSFVDKVRITVPSIAGLRFFVILMNDFLHLSLLYQVQHPSFNPQACLVELDSKWSPGAMYYSLSIPYCFKYALNRRLSVNFSVSPAHHLHKMCIAVAQHWQTQSFCHFHCPFIEFTKDEPGVQDFDGIHVQVRYIA